MNGVIDANQVLAVCSMLIFQLRRAALPAKTHFGCRLNHVHVTMTIGALVYYRILD